MNRRRFLGTSALGGAALLATQPGCAPPPAPQPATSPVAATGNEEYELHEATIDSLQEGMRSGRLTARRITELYLARIEALNQRGPELRAIIETNPDALAIADQLDAERKAGKVRGPLHGIPIALKDNLDTHDRMTTTAGSLALEGSIPPQDSFVAQKLREAGAILLAKANMSEWAYWRGMKATQRLERSRRPVPQPLRARPQSLRLQLRIRGRRLGQPGGADHRHRDRRVDHVPVVDQRRGRHQADGRAVEPLGHHPDLALAGHGRADGAHGARRRHRARRGVRRRPARRRDGRQRRAVPRRLHDVPRPGGLKGARLGIARSFSGFHERVLKLFDEAVAA